MIGFLRGNVIHIDEASLILDVSGVGYKVETGTVGSIKTNEELELFIYTHVREQELRLFGFKNVQDLKLFEELLGVSGVGPKAAMSLLSTLGTKEILGAVEAQEWNSLKAPGVGNKTAQKIVLELNGKLENFGDGDEIDAELKKDAIMALENLGYQRSEIEDVLKSVKIEEEWGSEDLIRLLLKKMRG